ncbi:hypothetical protein OO013_04630 [Mangrovivirga sp. M17]|uniref:Uncharacterized protein n=1 Tax=Mangrovivirga halotolerans TaxID=2993936 RepID=A0ABT3RNT0_9BACT|nr:hypothetical protein [Mangrovivirga halotolerans]MCX2743136.1 hypothetical protein [Mangrovivirga halotolerans]
MKNYHKIVYQIVFLMSFILIGCSTDKEAFQEIENANQQTISFNDLFDKLDRIPDLIVENSASLQNALKDCKPGDLILLAPGTYDLPVSVSVNNITLFGAGQVLIKNPENSAVSIFPNSNVQNLYLHNVKLENYSDSPEIKQLQFDTKRNKRFISYTKEILAGDIAHYVFSVRLGNKDYDYINIHRLIRESSNKPIPTLGEIFMVHGANQNFVDIFLKAGASTISEATSLPIYLAKSDVDVWGIDMAWTRVPAETSDLSFMKDWGIERDVQHLEKAMKIARIISGITKQGFGKMNLMGFSYGSAVLYGAAGYETTINNARRNIKGMIPVDQPIKYSEDFAASRESSCIRGIEAANAIEDGIYFRSLNLTPLAQLAITDPDGISPAIPSFTNLQFILFIGANTYALGPSATPTWHFVAGIYDGPIPVGLNYTETERWLSLLAEFDSGPYMPFKILLDIFECECGEKETFIDQNLEDISLPIFNVSAHGGSGKSTLLTPTLTSSTDIENLMIKFYPDNPELDFGHADLLMATNAPNEFWEPLRNWVQSH